MSLSSEYPVQAPIVIVAEDQFLVRITIADALTEAGFEVIETGHAEQTLLILTGQGRNISALFTDIRMPGSMDGLGLAEYVRGHWPSIALLVTSDEVVPARSQLPAGAHFLCKPYHPRDVIACIRQLIAAKQASPHPLH
jgi:DNA-binding response OmpR family regulator